ncbi:hypothetical protein BJY52DRAFT_1301514 [Lactarius psammicola]|nr:hypothetical protein BJY52DRAFT_1301514 [Lactarius psammicola]
MPTPRRVNENFTDVPLLDHDIYALGSFHPVHRMAIENLRIPASQDPVTARVIQGDIDTPTTTIPLSIPEPSTATTPSSIAFTPPPGAVAVRHIMDYRTSSDVLAVPSLPSPTPVPDNMLPTGPSSFLDSPVTGTDRASSPESHSSLLAPAASGPSRARVSFAPDLSAAAERESSTDAALHKERDALMVIRENTVAALDIPPQSLSPSLVTNIAIAGPSCRPLGAEHTGGRPPQPSHS